MVLPGLPFSQALEWCCRVYHRLKELLKEKGLSTSVGDEGGFAPNVPGEDEALSLLMQAFDRAGFVPGQDFVLGLDAASSEWVVPSEEGGEPRYTLPKAQLSYTTGELISHWEGLCAKYPIRSIEDPLGENDWQGFVQITHRLGSRDPRGGAPGAARRLAHHPVPPLRRDRGQHHRGHRGGLRRGADQDRRPLPRGADGEVQSASPD